MCMQRLILFIFLTLSSSLTHEEMLRMQKRAFKTFRHMHWNASTDYKQQRKYSEEKKSFYNIYSQNTFDCEKLCEPNAPEFKTLPSKDCAWHLKNQQQNNGIEHGSEWTNDIIFHLLRRCYLLPSTCSLAGFSWVNTHKHIHLLASFHFSRLTIWTEWTAASWREKHFTE